MSNWTHAVIVISNNRDLLTSLANVLAPFPQDGTNHEDRNFPQEPNLTPTGWAGYIPAVTQLAQLCQLAEDGDEQFMECVAVYGSRGMTEELATAVLQSMRFIVVPIQNWLANPDLSSYFPYAGYDLLPLE